MAFIGTFVPIVAGAGVVTLDRISNGAVIHLGISLVFGTAVTALIYSLGLLAHTLI